MIRLLIESTIRGRIEDTDEPCIMQATGYWTSNSRRITSYERG